MLTQSISSLPYVGQWVKVAPNDNENTNMFNHKHVLSEGMIS